MSSLRQDDTPAATPKTAPAEQSGRRGGRIRTQYRRAREAARRRRALDLTWRFTVLMVGFAIIVGGLVMLLTPGPGWAAIIIGLAVLATEYVWAERLLGRVKKIAQRAAERALDPRKRRRNQILLAFTLVVLIALVWAYLGRYGFTLPDWLTN